MKKLENFFNSKKGKIVAWLTVLLVVLLALLAIWFVKIKPQRNTKPVENPIEMNQPGEGTGLIESSSEINNESGEQGEGEPSGEEVYEEPISYSKLTQEDYQINNEKNTISFDNDIEMTRFVLSDNPNGPIDDDTWHDVNESQEVELESDEIVKKYVYYYADTVADSASQTTPFYLSTTKKYYSSLAYAYSALGSSTSATITFYNDSLKTDNSTFTIASGKTITLNTNGKEVMKNTDPIKVNSGGKLIIKGRTELLGQMVMQIPTK